MKLLRPIIFWLHLACGLTAGLVIGIMCCTGTALAFEKQLVAWADRDVRRVTPPPENAPRLTVGELQAKLRAAQPEARPVNLVLQNDPRAAVAFASGGRGGGGSFYVNPYTGEVRRSQPTSMSAFMQTAAAWHRTLGFTGGESRPRGKFINGACNVAFCFLAITGLYLWMPRHWSPRGVKAIAIFNGRLTGRARDFNRHNAIGLWSAPILIVLTLTAIPMSFQWGTRVINTLTGTPQSAAGSGGPGGAFGAQPAIGVPPPPAGAKPLNPDALIAVVQKEVPSWETITLNLGGGVRGGGGPGGEPARRRERAGDGGAPPPARTAAPAAPTPAVPTVTAPSRAPAVAPPATFTVRSRDSWPRTANLTLALNPYTGEILRRTGYADQAAAQRVRSWTRFLHTGEALGPIGQLVAGLACLGGCFLVYTGFALSWRRFFVRSTPAER
jgi:uncharacterized iron-regulated membrane protein